MSAERAALSIGVVESLIESGRGDQGRLMFIQRCMKNNRALYESDRRYLEMLVAGDSPPAEDSADVNATPLDTGELEMVCGLMRRSLGDQGRLGYMRRTLESGRGLRHSDAEYLRAKYAEYAGADTPDVEPIISANPVVGQQMQSVANTSPPHRVDAAEDESPEDATYRMSALEAVKAEMASTQLQIEDDRRALESISDYKDRLADRMEIHQRLLQEMKDELRGIKGMVREQSGSIEEQARALDAVRSERKQLEEDSQRLVGVTAELVEERKRLAAVRKASRELKEKERSLAKTRKDIEKVNRDIQKERDKVAKKLEEEKTKLKEQTALKRSLARETAKLNETQEKKDQAKRSIKMAERVLQESRGRASSL